jgi:ligand-binding sensor domain-containing protein
MTIRAPRLLWGVLLLSAAGLDGKQLPVRAYTTADGLAHNFVSSIFQDSRGFVWFSTIDGLSRFDGYQFTNFGLDQGLPGRLSMMAEGDDGTYWIASWEGLYHFDPTLTRPRFTVCRPGDPKAKATHSLFRDGSGGFWVGTQGGLYHLQKAAGHWKLRFVDIGTPNQNWDDTEIESVVMDRHGTLWIGGFSGLYRRLPDGRTTRYTSADGLPDTHIAHLREDHQGRIWVGTWGGLCRLRVTAAGEPAIEKVYTAKTGLAGNVITALFESSDGTMWIGTGDGLSERSVKNGIESFENYTTANGLTSNQVWSIAEDRAGNLWMGSYGALRLSKGGFITYTQQDGLANDFVISIFENQKGELCALTKPSDHTQSNPTMINVFDGSRFHAIRPNIPGNRNYYGWAYREPALQDHTGAWWIATSGGIYRYPPISETGDLAHVRPAAFYATRGNLPGEDVVRIFEDSRGDVWIGTYAGSGSPLNGLARWDRASNSLHRYPAMESVSFDRLANDIVEDHKGNIWIGFHTGHLVRYRRGQFRVFTKADGLPFGQVVSLHVDLKGRLWVSGDRGLVRIDSPDAETPGFVHYGTADGLATYDVESITDDDWGRVYIGSDRGIDVFSTRTALHVRRYTAVDGLSRGTGVAFRDRPSGSRAEKASAEWNLSRTNPNRRRRF